MHWITLTLIATFFFAVENIIDKKIADSTQNTTSALFIMNITKIPALILLWIFWYPEIYITPYLLFWGLVIGIIATVTGFVYLKVFQYGDAATVMPMYELSPLWLIFLGYIFFGELPHHYQYLAMVFLITGALVFGYQKTAHKITWKSFFSTALLLVLISSFGYSLQYTLSKFAIQGSNIESIFVLNQTFYAVISSLISFFILNKKGLHCISISNKLLGLSIIVQGIGIFAYVIYTHAFTDGVLSLVSALSSVQSLFVIMLSGLLTYMVPSCFREKWGKDSLLQKSLGTLLIAMGVVLMYVVS